MLSASKLPITFAAGPPVFSTDFNTLQLVVLLCFLFSLCDIVADNIAIVVLSQPNVYSAHRAELFRDHVISESEMLHVVSRLTTFTRTNACSAGTERPEA